MSNTRSSQEQAEAIEESAFFSGLDRLIDIQLLYLIHQGSASGYDLRRIMQRRFHVTLSYGTIYPHLKNFERRRLAIGTWGQRTDRRSRKKIFAITDKGKATLQKCLAELATMNEELRLRS